MSLFFTYCGTRNLPGEALVITFFMQRNFCAKLQQIIILFTKDSQASDPQLPTHFLNELH